MNEKELKKLLIEKQHEMEAAQREYERAHYSKHLRYFSDTFTNSLELLELIQSEKLSADDCKLLAGVMVKKIGPIYRNFTDVIERNRQRRNKKNQARNERRHKADVKPVTTTATTPKDNTAVKQAAVHTSPIVQKQPGEITATGKRQY